MLVLSHGVHGVPDSLQRTHIQPDVKGVGAFSLVWSAELNSWDGSP